MGGCRCSFRSCEHRSNTDVDTHFFHYPFRQRERCELWARNAGRLEYMELPNSQLRNKVVCQHHFRDKCFMNYLHKSLTKTAVPTFIRLPGNKAGVMDYETSENGQVVMDGDAEQEPTTYSIEEVTIENNEDSSQHPAAEPTPIHMEIILPIGSNSEEGHDHAELHEIEYETTTLQTITTDGIMYIHHVDNGIGVDEEQAEMATISNIDSNDSRSRDVKPPATVRPVQQNTPPPKILNGLKLKKLVQKRPAASSIQMHASTAKSMKLTETDDSSAADTTDHSTGTAAADLQLLAGDDESTEQNDAHNKNALITATNEYAHLRSILTEYEAIIAELRADEANHKATVADHLNRQQQLQNICQSQTKRLAVQQQQQQQHASTVEALRRTNTEQTDQIDQQEAHIELLRSEHIIEVQQLRDQVDHLEGSNRELRTRIDRQSQQIQVHQKQQQQAAASAAAAIATLREEHAAEMQKRQEHIEQLEGINVENLARIEQQTRQIEWQKQQQAAAVAEAAAAATAAATAAAATTAAAVSAAAAVSPAPAPTSSTTATPPPLTSSSARAKPEKLPLLSKPQLYNSIRKYLNPSMNTLVRMEMFADVGREYKSDERQIAMELWELPVAADGSVDATACSSAGSVYEYMRGEWRFRLPPKGEVLQWIRERDENVTEPADDWDDC